MPQRTKLSVLALLLLFAMVFVAPAPAASLPTATTQRAPWTTSHVHGSPEPPPPYQLQRVYPKLSFKQPTDMTFAPGSDRRFVAEQGGKIYSFPDDENCTKADLFFDAWQVKGWKDIKGCRGIDSLYGVAFHPKYAENHQVFICYALAIDEKADRTHGLRVSRFTVIPGDKPTDAPHVDINSEQILLAYWSFGHCGGCLKFGRDGCLYISTGDGGNPTPPDGFFNTGQDISDLLASILRIDVDHKTGDLPYAIPADNPFVNTPKARGEVWAYGLRNPWRMSFDSQTGELWAGDVGWETWESIQHIVKAGNYGWSVTEGPGPAKPNDKRGPTPILPPADYFGHDESASLTGGFVYRGTKLPELVGHYICGDWETRRLWASQLTEQGGLNRHRTIAMTEARVVCFAEEPKDHELFVVDYEAGGIHRIVPQQSTGTNAQFPRQLSATGLFEDVRKLAPAAGVVPFEPNTPQWVDYGIPERLAAIPGTGAIKFNHEGKQKFPADSVLVRTFSMEMEAGNPASRRKLETQLLHYDGKHWLPYTYRWSDDQTDASLVGATGDEMQIAVKDASAPGGRRQQTWRFASRAQCMVCHNPWADFTLAFNLPQLTRAGGSFDPAVLSLFDKPPAPAKQPLVNPYDESANLQLRARSYLNTNCAHCHRFGGGGSANIELQYDVSNEKTKAIDAQPTQGNFGIEDAKVIAPGAATRSVLFYRLSKTGSGHMPHAGSEEIDPRGVPMIGQWIDSLSKPPTPNTLTAHAHAYAHANVPEAALDAMLANTTDALGVSQALGDRPATDAAVQRVAARAYKSEKPEIRDLFARFMPADQRIKTLGANFRSDRVLTLDGDAQRGHAVFATLNDGLCAKCHRVGNEGANFGPDLTHVGSKYDRAQLLENIAEPSKTIAQGFAASFVKVKHGEPQIGLLISRNDTELVLRTGPGVDVKIPAADVERVTTQTQSLMPEGLLSGLTAQQAADLLEYLQSLK